MAGGSSNWLLSSDSHVIEPPDLWAGRVPTRLRDAAPRVERVDGADWWVLEGKRTVSYAAPSAAGIRFDGGPDALERDIAFEDAIRGGHVPALHVTENEADGVWGSVLYPSIALMTYAIEDSAVLTACTRAYNDWIAEFCSEAPDRLKGVALLNVDNVEEAVKELVRTQRIGLVSATMPMAPLQPYDDPVYDPLWSKAEELGIPLSIHTGTIRDPAVRTGRSRVDLVTKQRFMERVIASLVFGHVFERFPDLTILSVEFEFGWAPHLLTRMDDAYLQRRHWEGRVRFGDDLVPSDFVRRNISFSFQEDAVGLRLRDYLGTDRLLWGSDYPHGESTFPRSRPIVDELLAELTQLEQRQVSCDNTALLYGFQVPA
jgi:predicted TIM-barrel fold metal-dependent hydrolase